MYVVSHFQKIFDNSSTIYQFIYLYSGDIDFNFLLWILPFLNEWTIHPIYTQTRFDCCRNKTFANSVLGFDLMNGELVGNQWVGLTFLGLLYIFVLHIYQHIFISLLLIALNDLCVILVKFHDYLHLILSHRGSKKAFN